MKQDLLRLLITQDWGRRHYVEPQWWIQLEVFPTMVLLQWLKWMNILSVTAGTIEAGITDENANEIFRQTQ